MNFITFLFLIGHSLFLKNKIPSKEFINQIDCIPNEKKAKELAKTVLLKTYGTRIYSEMPFIARLQDSVWIVKDSKSGRKKGGVAYMEINKIIVIFENISW